MSWELFFQYLVKYRMTMNDDEDDGDDGGDVNSHDDDVPKGVKTSGFSKCVKS